MEAVLILIGFIALSAAVTGAVWVATRNRQAEARALEAAREVTGLRTAVGAVYSYAWRRRDAVPELQVVTDLIERDLGTADEIILTVRRDHREIEA